MSPLTRRTFVKSSAALAALSAAGPAWAAPNERVNVAILGCRNRGNQVANMLRGSGEFNIVRLCDPDDAMLAIGQEKVESEQPIPTEKDFRKVLEDKEVDAVVVATPDHWHAQMTVMALEAGKHVYLEKPASYNIEDGKAMVAAQRKHPKLVVAMGTQQRSGAHFHEAAEFIQSGGAGKIGFARGMIAHNRHIVPLVANSRPPEGFDYDMWVGPAPFRPYNEPKTHYNWHFMHDYGTGEIGNWGAHWLDVNLWFLNLGFPKAVTAHGGQFVVHDAKEWPDTHTVIYEYPDVTMVWEHRLWTKFGVGGGMWVGSEFDGEKGSVLIDRGGWVFYPKDGEPEEHGGSDMNASHARNFAQAIRGEAKPAASIHEGHKTATLCHLGNISHLVGRRVVFDEETQTIVGDEEAQALAGREYREPWGLEAYL